MIAGAARYNPSRMPAPGTTDAASVTLLRAAWLAPTDRPPIRDGAVAISGTRVAAVGTWRDLAGDYPGAPVHDAGEAVILPGLVNAHTHLELTHIPRRPLPAGGF